MKDDIISRKDLLSFAIRGINAEIIESAKKLDSDYAEYGYEGLKITQLSDIRKAIGEELKALN